MLKCHYPGAKQAVSTASTEKKQSEMELEHIKSELVKKEKLLNENSKTHSHDVTALAKMDKEVAVIAVCIFNFKYLSVSCSTSLVNFVSINFRRS